MILADKIIRLRKQFGWSQEDLAGKMNVSRQSVSKWESANSIPDLNKIISLGEIFGVSTDYLLKDEIEEIESFAVENETGVIKITLEKANEYIENKVTASRITSYGVVVILSSLIPLFILLGLTAIERVKLSSTFAIALGLMLMLVMVGLATSLFIKSSQYEAECAELEDEVIELAYGVKSIIKERLDRFKPIYQMRISISIMLLITCVAPLIAVALLGGSNFWIFMMLVVLIVMLTVGIFIIIPASAEFNAYNLLIGEGDFSPKKRDITKRTEKVASVYWPLITAIYLGWSLWTMDWGTTWIVWPVAGVLFAAIIGMVAMFGSDKKI